MPLFVVDKVQAGLNSHAKPVMSSSVHILGVCYNQDIDDVRESPALDIMDLLEKRGAKVSYSDSHVPSVSSMDISVRPKTSQAAWSGQIAS